MVFVVGVEVPVEFIERSRPEVDPVVGMREYGTYGMPGGTFFDDSSMTIATMASTVNNGGKIVYENLMIEFLEWKNNSKYTQYGSAFDIGITTSGALSNFENDTCPTESGLSGECENGNGRVMRILPLAFMEGTDYKTIEEVSALTHAHSRSKMTCLFTWN